MRAQDGFDRIAETAHPGWFSGAFVALRVAVGLQFLLSGFGKVMSDWSAASYLAAADGPFAEWFQSLSGVAFVDGLNAWGQLLIGVAFVVGLGVRPAAIGGAVMMVLYYLAHFTENIAHGFIEEHVILAIIFVVFAAGGAGNVLGLNAVAMGALRKPAAAVRFLLG